MYRSAARYLSTFKSSGKYTLDFKKYAIQPEDPTQLRSFFHDIPLNFNKAHGTVDMIVEIPRYEQGKFEISKELPFNPIVQDTKKGALRFINNIYPHNGYPCNYGALPQTWEDPTIPLEINHKKYFGDNDPLDVCEIGSASPSEIGARKTVKILGCLAMIDDGELDWKLLSIDVADKRAAQLNDIDDVELLMPHLLADLTRWFKNYKLPMGKPENTFAFGGKWLNRSKALDVVEECHHRWGALVSSSHKGSGFPSIANATLKETPGFQTSSLTTASLPPAVDTDGEIPNKEREIYYYSC